MLLCASLWAQVSPTSQAAPAASGTPAIGSLQPRSLASADFNEDSIADVVSGYAEGGAVALFKGRDGAETGQAFAAAPQVWAAPLGVDLLGAGDFNADGHADLVFGARGGAKLVWWAGDGRGRFAVAGESALPGRLTALAVGELNRPDGLPDVVAGVDLGDGAGGVLVLEGPSGAGQAQAEAFRVRAPVTGLALGRLDGDALPDVAAAAGRELWLIAGRDRKLSLRAEEQATVRAARVSSRLAPAELRDVALGDFSGDGRLDVAALTVTGAVHVWRQPAGLRQWAAWRDETALSDGAWANAERLVAARVKGAPAAGVIGLPGAARVLERDKLGKWAETEGPAVNTARAVLPLQVNGDALDDLVILKEGAAAPEVTLSMPSAIITVNSNLDNNVRDTVLTLREAILLANQDPTLPLGNLTMDERQQVQGTPMQGLDEVRFNIPAPPGPVPPAAVVPESFGPAAAQPVAPAQAPGAVESVAAPAVGDVDGSFNAGIDDSVLAVAVLPNEQILVAGTFLSVNGMPRSRIAKLNPNGAPDPAFVPPVMNGLINAVAVRNDGKIYIGGEFTTIGGASRNRLARLNPDGALDDTFQNGLSGANDTVKALLLQPDGKLVAGGDFTTLNGANRSRLARFNMDGTLENGFPASDSGANGSVEAIARQSNGKLVIGGNFTSVNDTFRLRLARLESNGAIDTGFSLGVNSVVFALSVQNDDRILLGGSFTQFITLIPAVTRNRIARLNPDGALDMSFPSAGADNNVRAIFPQPDGKILLGGEFSTLNNIPRTRLGRLNADGSTDLTFLDGASGANERVTSVAVQMDGKALFGGNFTMVNGVPRNRLARLLASGNTIQFGSGQYAANENAGTTTLNVTRGDSTGAVAVNFATVAGGTATGGTSCDGGADYVNTSGTLSWADGEVTPKTITVGICEDLTVEGSETVRLVLSSPTGGATLGTPDTSTLTILDNDSCSYQLNPTAQTFSAGGGGGVIAVTVLNGCSWQAVSNVPWITTTATGNGNGMAAFTVAPNDTPQRTGTITIGGQTVTITQGEGCVYSISPTAVPNESAGGGNRFLNVFAGVGCQWMARSNATWLTIDPGSLSGSGNGIVNYVVENNLGVARTGTMTVAGQTFTVLQNGSGDCSYSIAPTIKNAGIGGESGTVNVTASAGNCAWMAVSNNPSFLTVTNGSGSGSGAFNYAVDANDTGSPRSGTITVTGGNTFTVLQGTNNSNLRSITLNSPLPAITDAITIDGWTQGGGGYAGPPLVEINGQNLAAAGGGDGLVVSGGTGSLLRGLALNRFASVNRRDSAIVFNISGGNAVEGCYLGTDANGIAAFAPANTSGLAAGISVRGSGGNRIGGTNANQRNLISGIDGRGILISDSSTNNQIQGNYIGTDVTGRVGLGFQRIGVNIQNAVGNTVGGTAAGAGNLISGNLDYGVFLQDDAQNNLVQGNQIGTNGTGLTAVANGNAGVFIYRPTGAALMTMNTIGGMTPTARNLISGNGTYGVVVGVGATATLVQGNYVGTNATGAAALPNTYGLTVTQATGSAVGGAVLGARNVIAGNRLTGVFMGALNNGQVGITGSTVQNNFIGTNAAGDAALANGRDGLFVEVQSVTNTILNNRIAFNGANGVRIPNVSDVPGTPAFRINISNNEIYGNAMLGIDLGPDGVTANDPGDPDGGANLLQNFPLLTGFSAPVFSNGKDGKAPTVLLNVNGTLNSTPNRTFRINWFFSNVGTCANNQNGPPLLFGSVGDVMTNGQGNAMFSFPLTFPNGIASGKINATATDQETGVPLNTSEFGPCFDVVQGSGTPTPTPTPAVVQFSAGNFAATESGGLATLTVTRTGSAAGAASVEYKTNDNNAFVACEVMSGAAHQRCDYTSASGTLSFAAGETAKSFSVPLTDDAYAEGNETLTVSLSNASGGVALGTPNAASVTIADDDTAVAGPRTYPARLTGAQEAPPVTTSASGQGAVTLNEAETQITVNMSFSNLSSAQTAAHIHGAAPVGTNAPVLFNLGTGNVTNVSFTVTPAQVAQLKAGMMYFNLHTNNFPNGEIRGQILPNPLESARFFVRQQYADFLAREPDAGGFDFWTGQITNTCGADLSCTRGRRIDVSNAFFFELEFQQTGAFVYRLYRAAYGNNQPFPNPMGDNDGHPHCQQNPQNCQLFRALHVPAYEKFSADRASLNASQLAATQQALAVAFAQRPEFAARYPLTQTAEQFVDAALATLSTLGVDLAGQRTALLTLYNSTAGGQAAQRGAVMFRLAEDNAAGNPVNNRAFIDAEYNKAFVTTQYYGYLRRDGDLPGLNFWLGGVNRFPLRSPASQNTMVCEFITSEEYQQRFGPLAPRSAQECPRPS